MGFVNLDPVDFEFFPNRSFSGLFARDLCESLCAHDFAIIGRVVELIVGFKKAVA